MFDWLKNLFLGGEKQMGGGSMLDMLLGSKSAPNRRTQSELLALYSQSPWLRAVAGKVAEGVSRTPFMLYAPSRSGRQRVPGKVIRSLGEPEARRNAIAESKQAGGLEEVEEHPLLDLLWRGNDFLSGQAVLELTQLHLDLAGESFWLLERNGAGVPTDILPLSPTWVQAIATTEEPFYRVSFSGWSGEIPAAEMVHFKAPNPADPYGRGKGIASALSDEIATDEYAAGHTKAFFYNRARPDLLISGGDTGLNQDEINRLEQRWVEKHEGFRNAYRPAFFSGPINVHEITQSFKDMELTELREFERDVIVHTFGVPPELLGILESSNKATIHSADYLFARWVLVPRLERIISVLQRDLLPAFDSRLILDYESPVAEDKEHKLEVGKAAPWSMKVDEWREMAGLEPLENQQGQVFMMPFNLVPQSSPSLVPQEPEEEGVRAIEPSVERSLSGTAISLITRLLEWGPIAAVLRPILRDTVTDFGNGQAAELDGSFDPEAPRVQEFLREQGGERIAGINETTRRKLGEALAEGVGEGEGIPELSARVESVFDEARGRRAEVIARSEVIPAANAGAHESYVQNGILGRSWLATKDNRVREAHEEIDGQKRAIGQPFEYQGFEAMYPGGFGVPWLDIQCRCTTIPELSMEDSRELTEAQRVARWKDFDARLRPFERRVRSGLAEVFNGQERAVKDAIREYAQQEQANPEHNGKVSGGWYD